AARSARERRRAEDTPPTVGEASSLDGSRPRAEVATNRGEPDQHPRALLGAGVGIDAPAFLEVGAHCERPRDPARCETQVLQDLLVPDPVTGRSEEQLARVGGRRVAVLQAGRDARLSEAAEDSVENPRRGWTPTGPGPDSGPPLPGQVLCDR